MQLNSHFLHPLPTGVALQITYEDAAFTAYVGISEPDPERAADWVPRQHFETADVHVAALSDDEPVADTLTDLLFNLNPGDALVLLCADAGTYALALQQLGYSPVRV